MSFKTLLENIEALRDDFAARAEDYEYTRDHTRGEQNAAFWRGRRDEAQDMVADLSRIITHWKAHLAPYKLVVCIDHGSFDGIYTTASKGMFEAFVHEYDLDNLPTPHVSDAQVIYTDDESIAQYTKPHGLKVKNLKADMDMPDDEVLVGVPDETNRMVYYPVAMVRAVHRSGYTIIEPAYPLRPIDPPAQEGF